MTTEYEVTVTRRYKDIPYSEKKYEITGRDESGEKEYGYVTYDSTKEVEVVVFTQIVDNLDLVSVIDSINNKG